MDTQGTEEKKRKINYNVVVRNVWMYDGTERDRKKIIITLFIKEFKIDSFALLLFSCCCCSLLLQQFSFWCTTLVVSQHLSHTMLSVYLISNEQNFMVQQSVFYSSLLISVSGDVFQCVFTRLANNFRFCKRLFQSDEKQSNLQHHPWWLHSEEVKMFNPIKKVNPSFGIFLQ